MSFFRVTCDCSCQEADSICNDHICPSQIGVSYTFPSATVETTQGSVAPVTCETTLKSVSGDLDIFNKPDAWGDNCGYRGTTTEHCVESPFCIPPITGDNFDVSCWNGDAVWEGATCGDQYTDPQVIPHWNWGRGVTGDCACITQDATCRDDGYCVKERNSSYHRHTLVNPFSDDYEFYCVCGTDSHCAGCPEGDVPFVNCAGYCSDCSEFVALYYVGAIQSKTTSALYYYDQSDNDLLNGWFFFIGRSIMTGYVARNQDCVGNWGSQVWYVNDESTCCENTQSIAWLDYPQPNHPHPECAPHLKSTIGKHGELLCPQYWGEDNPYIASVFEPNHPLSNYSNFGTWWALPKTIIDCHDLDGVAIGTSGVEIARRYCPYPNFYPPPSPDGRVVSHTMNSSPLYDTGGFEVSNWSISVA